jgi:hypothetical protein
VLGRSAGYKDSDIADGRHAHVKIPWACETAHVRTMASKPGSSATESVSEPSQYQPVPPKTERSQKETGEKTIRYELRTEYLSTEDDAFPAYEYIDDGGTHLFRPGKHSTHASLKIP